MTTRRDPEEILAAWLDEGPVRLPDMTRRAIVVALPTTTPRRHAWSAPWRFPTMSTIPKLALGAVAVIAIVLGSVLLLGPGRDGVGGPQASPTPAPTPIPSSLPAAQGVTLAPGTYMTGDPFPFRISMTVPAGWQGNVGGVNGAFLNSASNQSQISFTMNQALYADPCHYDQAALLSPQPGPSVDEFATALSATPGMAGTTPTDTAIDGRAGKQVTLTAPTSTTDCTLADNAYFRLWILPLGGTQDLNPGQRDRFWVLDVDGQRLVVDAMESPGQTSQETAEVQSILDSIHIDPAVTTADWVPFTSARYGYTVMYPPSWQTQPADHDWTEADAAAWPSTGADWFRPADQSILTLIFATQVPPGTTLDQWVDAHGGQAPTESGASPSPGTCPRTDIDLGIATVSGHPVRFQRETAAGQCGGSYAFILAGDTMYVVDVGRPNQEQLLKAFVSTLQLPS